MSKPAYGCALILAAALLLGACGGDDEGGGDNGADTATTDGDFVASANAVCVDRAVKIKDQFNQVVNPTTAQEFANLLPERVEIEEAAVEELGVLEPSAELEAGYRVYLDKEEAVAEAHRQALEAANRVDTPAYVRANRVLDQAQLAAARAAADVGLGDCANHLPAAVVADVTAVLEDIWTVADPAHCTEDYTNAYVEELGGLEACEKGELPSAEADSIDFGGRSGTQGVTASVEVTVHGGSHDGEIGQNFLEYEDGRWKLDQVLVIKPPSK